MEASCRLLVAWCDSHKRMSKTDPRWALLDEAINLLLIDLLNLGLTSKQILAIGRKTKSRK